MAVWSDRSHLLNEAHFMEKCGDADPSDPGRAHVLNLLDYFHHTGPHGKHACIFTELLGGNIDDIQAKALGGKIPPDVMKHIAKQLLQALSYLHDKCGITHTDVKSQNILLVNRDINMVRE
ncbi:hypothetical protein BOTBODRAFT_181526 [Botryobasidium botryosum FD-172 SS1]|uniref:non-specific serine/threonine protein kinase n=1 Tax=Botryobasidium botryosum (strain FD-172 SS1) TaxID=930990 RepID=A0A067LT91_BOTB1|nr:hypothetical protein BOTBODRAFT_181526 [Botryobasidium botryosum FD-172 SS1]